MLTSPTGSMELSVILRKSDYHLQREPIKTWLKNNEGKDPLLLIPEIAVASHCHILIVSHFVGDVVGFTPELLAKIEVLEKFYKVSVED